MSEASLIALVILVLFVAPWFVAALWSSNVRWVMEQGAQLQLSPRVHRLWTGLAWLLGPLTRPLFGLVYPAERAARRPRRDPVAASEDVTGHLFDETPDDGERTQAPLSDFVLRSVSVGGATAADPAPQPLQLGRNVIGRQPTAVRDAHLVALPHDPAISRNHLFIDLAADGRLTVTDNRSQFGARLNDASLKSGRPTPLRLGDRLRLGNTLLTVERMGGGAPDRPSADARHAVAETPPDNGVLRIEIAPEYRLRVIEGPDRGKQLLIGAQRLSIGRQPDCDWRLSGSRVSRRHAEVWQEGQVVRIRDAGSTHGLKVNRHPHQDRALDPGDQIEIGENTLVFERL